MIGYTYFNKKGFIWRINHNAIIPLTMPHINHYIDENIARNILKEHQELLIRWDDNFDQFDTSEWWYIIKDQPEKLENLSSNTRSKVRRGLRTFICEPCSMNVIVSEGYSVYLSAFRRYTTFEYILNQNEFVKAIKKLPNKTEFWAVRDAKSKIMVSFSENIICDNTCFYNTIWFQPEGLKHYSSYALFYKMNKHYLNEKGFKYVSDGARSISHQTNIHEFLQSKFGFRKAYSSLHVSYVAWLAPVVFCLYPFRNWIKKIPGTIFQKISIVLEQERIRRSCLRLPMKT